MGFSDSLIVSEKRDKSENIPLDTGIIQCVKTLKAIIFVAYFYTVYVI